MATVPEKKAKEAFFDDEFALAVDLYSEAIRLDPNDANLFADRAQAHIKLNAFTEAVSDANKSIQLNPSLPKAYLRKATACIKLQEYHTAKVALQNGAAFAQDDSRFANLIQQCDRCIAGQLTKTSSCLGFKWSVNFTFAFLNFIYQRNQVALLAPCLPIWAIEIMGWLKKKLKETVCFPKRMKPH